MFAEEGGMGLTEYLTRSAARRGNHTALVCGQRRRSWSEFEERVARLAAALRHLGVVDGDRVAMLANNSARCKVKQRPRVQMHQRSF